MNRLVTIISSTVLVVSLLSGCNGNSTVKTSKDAISGTSSTAVAVTSEEKSSTAEVSSEAMSVAVEQKASFILDFEEASMLVGPTVNFDPAFTKDHILFVPQTGFAGNVYKAVVAPQTQGGTWWVSGVALDKNGSEESKFKDLKTISFKYSSTVEFINSPFVVQFVWKDKTTGDKVATVEEEFPMEKTSEIKTFTINVPQEVATDLNDASNYYLDWFMVGLKENAGGDFKSGTFYIDDISFSK